MGREFSPELRELLLTCPICKEDQVDSDVAFLGAQGDYGVWHVRQSGCGHALLAVVLRKKTLLSAVGLATDLSATDAARMCCQSSVSLGDVLKTHQSLEDSLFLERLRDGLV